MAGGERDRRERARMKALAGQYSREDLLRAFDLLSLAEYQIRQSSQPRHHFEMTLLKWIHLRKLTPLSELLAGGGVRGAEVRGAEVRGAGVRKCGSREYGSAGVRGSGGKRGVVAG